MVYSNFVFEILFINKEVTIKILSSVIKKRWCTYIFFMTSGKEMSNNCALCFDRIDFVVVPSSNELL